MDSFKAGLDVREYRRSKNNANAKTNAVVLKGNLQRGVEVSKKGEGGGGGGIKGNGEKREQGR